MRFGGRCFVTGAIGISLDFLVARRRSCVSFQWRAACCLTSSLSAPQPPVMTIDPGVRYRVTIPADFDMEAAARLLNGLVVSR